MMMNDFSIPKKMYRAAMQSALSSKQVAGELSVINELNISEPKTKQVAAIITRLGLGRSVLLVVGVCGVCLSPCGCVSVVHICGVQRVSIWWCVH